MCAEFRKEDFEEVYYVEGDQFAARVPTWIMNPKMSWELFQGKFSKNPRQSARDYGNKPTQALEEKFFQNPALLEEIASASKLKHPFENDDKLVIHKWFRPCCRAHYYIHGDLGAKRDALGVGCVHRCRKSRKITVDFALRVKIPVGGDLHIKTFRQLVYRMFSLNFWVKKVTTDSWQSIETHQELKRRGIESEIYSVDRNTEPWDTFWDLAVEKRVDFYMYEPFLEEAKELLLIDGKKVDHPSGGSKDVCDGVVGAVAQCMMGDSQGTELKISFI